MIINVDVKPRNSSVELLRIICIWGILIHHFVAHGISLVPGFELSFTWQNVLSYIVGWGGNTGNAVFVIITGYYMILKSVHWKKVLLLLSTLFLYSWCIGLLSFTTGLVPYSGKEILKILFPIWTGANWFVCCYIIFICFVPFINPLLQSFSKQRYIWFIVINYLMFILIPILHGHTFGEGMFIQFFIMYAIGGYFRRFPFQGNAFGGTQFWKRILLICITLIFLMAVIIPLLGKGKIVPWRMVAPFELFIAISLFMIAIRHQFYNRWINSIANSVLGIYLIHDNPLVRNFIWRRWLPNIDYLDSPYFAIFMIGKVVIVFLACLMIDQLRIRFVEPTIRRYIDNRWSEWGRIIENKRNRWTKVIEKL